MPRGPGDVTMGQGWLRTYAMDERMDCKVWRLGSLRKVTMTVSSPRSKERVALLPNDSLRFQRPTSRGLRYTCVLNAPADYVY